MTLSTPAKVVLLAVLGLCLAGASLPASDMVATAWTIEGGVIQPAVTGALATVGVSLASAIAFVTAILAVFSLLFIIDSRKMMQGVLFALVLPVFIWILRSYDLWIITWSRYPFAIVAGLLVGSGLGLRNGRMQAGTEGQLPRIREFPSAARGLYWLVVIAVVGGFIQVHVLAGELGGLPVNLIAGMGLIAATGVFTTYSDDRSVVLISPEPTEEANVLGGLYESARVRFGAESLKTTAERSLDRGRTITSPSGETEQFGMAVRAAAKRNLEPLNGTAGFRFRAPGFLGQTLEIRGNGYSPDALSSSDLEAIATETASADSLVGNLSLELRQVARQYLPQLLPKALTSSADPSSMNAREAVIAADSVLLIVSAKSLPEGLEEAAAAAEQSVDQRDAVVSTYKTLCQKVSGSGRNVEIVVTDANEVGHDLETEWQEQLESVDPMRLGNFINGRRLDGTSCNTVGVYRITNPDAEGPETKLWGADELLDRLY